MKKLFVALVLASGLFLQKADAQVRVGVNINIGSQPEWGPYGYDYAQFYYLPDIDVYYDVLNNQFIYFDGFDWRSSSYLPPMYSNFDLYNAYKVVINEPRPYLRADYYRRQYYSYRGHHNQPVLRDYRNRDFDHRNERYDNRNQRYDDHDRMEGNNRNYDQRDNRNYGQRDNRNFDQRDNRNYGQRDNRSYGQGDNRNFDQRGGQNSGQRNNGFDQRNSGNADQHDNRSGDQRSGGNVDQKNNGNADQHDNRNADQRDNRNSDQRNNGAYGQRDNRGFGQGGNQTQTGRGSEHGGFSQRGDSRTYGRH